MVALKLKIEGMMHLEESVGTAEKTRPEGSASTPETTHLEESFLLAS